MKISVSGCQCIGKSTFINDFLNEWRMYKKSSHSYRQIIKEKNLTINKEGTEEAQKIILNALVDEITENKDGKNVIFDRCVLDNLVYTLWLNSKNKVSDEFVKTSIKIVFVLELFIGVENDCMFSILCSGIGFGGVAIGFESSCINKFLIKLPGIISSLI